MESLLVCLLSDIYGTIERSQVTLFALFDINAAFHTANYDIFLQLDILRYLWQIEMLLMR